MPCHAISQLNCQSIFCELVNVLQNKSHFRNFGLAYEWPVEAFDSWFDCDLNFDVLWTGGLMWPSTFISGAPKEFYHLQRWYLMALISHLDLFARGDGTCLTEICHGQCESYYKCLFRASDDKSVGFNFWYLLIVLVLDLGILDEKKPLDEFGRVV